MANVEVHGLVSGSRPEHKVGDKSRVLKGRGANPSVSDSQIAAGFERFLSSGQDAQRARKRINWAHQDMHGGPKGRKHVGPVPHVDRPSGKGCPPPIKRASPRNQGLKWFPELRSDVSMEPHFDRKRRVVDNDGKRIIDKTSKSWEFHQLYGRLKQFGGKRSKAFHHGIFPSEKNYPPSHDKDGKWIDYSLVQYGGNLCDRGLRITEDVAPPKEHLNNRSTLPRGAAKRFYQQRKVDAINAGQASIDDFTLKRFNSFGGGSRPRTGRSVASSRASVASRGGSAGAGIGGPDWRDAKLASLRAELNSLKRGASRG